MQKTTTVIKIEKDKLRVTCDLCGRILRNRDGLTSHKKQMHGRQKVLENHTKCQECSLDLYKVDRLRDHLSTVHNMEMSFEIRAFLTMQDFFIWKVSYERQHNCSYVIKKKNSNPDDFLYLFDCSRSGVYKNRKATSKRSLKSQGTKKIGFTCTSTIKLTKLGGLYCVRFCKTHYGHDIEVEHANLSVVDRQEIAEMLTQGLSVDDILDKYKEFKGEDLQRIHLLKRKDIRNIAATYNIPLKSRTKSKKQDIEETKLVNFEERYKFEGDESETDVHFEENDNFEVFEEGQGLDEDQEIQTTEVISSSNLILINEDCYSQTFSVIPQIMDGN